MINNFDFWCLIREGRSTAAQVQNNKKNAVPGYRSAIIIMKLQQE